MNLMQKCKMPEVGTQPLHGLVAFDLAALAALMKPCASQVARKIYVAKILLKLVQKWWGYTTFCFLHWPLFSNFERP